MASPASSAFGSALRSWRQRGGRTQMELALQSNTSARHLSFLESGRAQPSRAMILRLAAALDVPLRDRNRLLLAAGFAPVFGERPLADDQLEHARKALNLILEKHDPYPALVVNRRWDILMANKGAQMLLGWLAPAGVANHDSPLNAFRLLLDPAALRPYVQNWAECMPSLVLRMRRELGDLGQAEGADKLLKELLAFPGVQEAAVESDLVAKLAPLLPVTYVKDGLRLSWFTTVTTFGTPQDATLQDLRIEGFFPADATTENRLSALCVPRY